MQTIIELFDGWQTCVIEFGAVGEVRIGKHTLSEDEIVISQVLNGMLKIMFDQMFQ